MSIQAIPVFLNVTEGGGEGGGDTGGGGGTPSFSWPDVTWAGNQITRRIARYGGVWYAEYLFWKLASQAFTVGGGGVTVDFYLISPGETGAVGSGAGGGAGGGAGTQNTYPGIALAAGDYTMTVSQSVTSVSGASGTISLATPTGGLAAGTPYRLYGDAEAEYGQVTAKGPGDTISPGVGAGGCTFLPQAAPRTVHGTSSSNAALKAGAVGVGAGGNGGGRTSYYTGSIAALAAPGLGAAGMILMRAALGVV